MYLERDLITITNNSVEAAHVNGLVHQISGSAELGDRAQQCASPVPNLRAYLSNLAGALRALSSIPQASRVTVAL
jgi:hypothetical protein